MHYAPNHLNQKEDGTMVNLHLMTGTPRELYYVSLTQADSVGGLLNPPFLIPANTERILKSESRVGNWVPLPISVFTLTPHAHVFGKSFKAYAYRPGTTDTVPLTDIPKWGFYWQSTCTLRKPIKLLINIFATLMYCMITQ